MPTAGRFQVWLNDLIINSLYRIESGTFSITNVSFSAEA